MKSEVSFESLSKLIKTLNTEKQPKHMLLRADVAKWCKDNLPYTSHKYKKCGHFYGIPVYIDPDLKEQWKLVY